MIKGICPTCNAELNKPENVIVTRESSVFKGHNVYVMCKHCGLVMVYNTTRELLYNLDKYQHDEEVLLEVHALLQEVDPNLTVLGEEEPEFECTHDCSTCSGCCGCSQEETEEVEEEKPVEQNITIDEDSLLLIDKTNPKHIIIVSIDELSKVNNLENYESYALSPVIIKPVTTYEIERM